MTLTQAQRELLLSDPDMQASFRLEVLDPDLTPIDDSHPATSVEIEHHSYADIHRQVRFTTDVPLEWGVAHVRPYVTVEGAGLTDTQLMGTFVTTDTPQLRDSEKPLYAVAGFDLVYRMRQVINGSFTAPRDRSYLDSVSLLCAQQNLAFRHPPGSTLSPTVPRSWTITDNVEWVGVANELLAAVGFQGLSADPYGTAYSEPYVEPAARPISCYYDATAPASTVVANDGEMSHPYTAAPNQWIAYRIDPEAGPPRPGDGMAIRNNRTRGPNSQTRCRVVKTRKEQVDAVDQDALRAAVRALRDEDGDTPRVLRIVTKPNIWHGHLDVVHVLDPRTETNGRLSQLSWLLRIGPEGAEMSHELREVATGGDE